MHSLGGSDGRVSVEVVRKNSRDQFLVVAT